LLGDGKSLSSSITASFGDQMGVRQTQSDSGGRYTIVGVGKGKDLILAAEDATEGRSQPVVIPAGADSRTVDLRLGGVGGVAGTVRAGGAAASGARVMATPRGVTHQNMMVTAGEDGAYVIDRLAPGTYGVTAMVGSGLGMTSVSRQVTISSG